VNQDRETARAIRAVEVMLGTVMRRQSGMTESLRKILEIAERIEKTIEKRTEKGMETK
jgi:hypothetical protein